MSALLGTSPFPKPVREPTLSTPHFSFDRAPYLESRSVPTCQPYLELVLFPKPVREPTQPTPVTIRPYLKPPSPFCPELTCVSHGLLSLRSPFMNLLCNRRSRSALLGHPVLSGFPDYLGQVTSSLTRQSYSLTRHLNYLVLSHRSLQAFQLSLMK